MFKEAKLYINNKWVCFIEESGEYDNIMSYLDRSNLSFVKTNNIDFSTVPSIYHGAGVSHNLSEYLSNNSNNDLIFSFIEYYLKELNFKYIDDTIFEWNIENSGYWMTSKVKVIDKQKDILYTLKVDQTIYSADNYYITSDMIEKYG